MVSPTLPLIPLAIPGDCDAIAAMGPTVMMLVGLGVLAAAIITAIRDARAATIQRPHTGEPAAPVDEAA